MATLPIAVPGSLSGKSEAPPPNVPIGLDAERATARTLWGIVFIGLGLGVTATWMVVALAFASAPYSASGASWVAIGLPLLTLFGGVVGRLHGLRVQIAMTLAVIAVILGVVSLLLGPSASDANVSASSLRLQLLCATLSVLLGSIVVYLVIDRLTTPRMRLVAMGALVAALVVQVAVYIVVSGAIAANLPLGLIGQDTPPLHAVQNTWGSWVDLNAIPFVLFLAAYESAYWRLRRELLPSLPRTAA